MRKKVLIILIGSALMISGSLAPLQAQTRSERRPGMRAERRGGILMMLKARQDELGVSDEQLETIRQLQLQLEETQVRQQNAANLQRLEMKKLMADPDNPEYDKLQSAMENMSRSRIQARIETMKLRNRIRNVLTPEQREELRSGIRDRMSGMRQSIRNRRERPNRPLPRIRREN